MLGGDLKLTLTKHEVARSWGGPVSGTGPVFEYKVDGMPPGEEAFIANFGGRNKASWRALRTKDGVPGEWTGDDATDDDALAALQKALGG